MTFTASNVEVPYDAAAHSLAVNVTTPGNAVVTYSNDGGSTYTETDSPEITDYGTMIVYYKITAATYATVQSSATVKINKATGTFPASLSYTGTYDPAVSFSDIVAGITVSGDLELTDTDKVAEVTDTVINASFTDSSGNFQAVSGTIALNISRAAAPTHITPTGLTATFGDTLSGVNINQSQWTLGNGDWTWDDASSTPVGNVGSNSFAVTFTPNDTVNYLTAVDTVSVTVSSPDKSALLLAIGTSVEPEADCLAASWVRYQTALTAANVVNSNPNVTPAQVSGATSDLLTAISELVDITALVDKLIEAIDALATVDGAGQSVWTSASKSALESIVNDANDMLAQDVTQVDIDQMTSDLDSGIKALQRPYYPGGGTTPDPDPDPDPEPEPPDDGGDKGDEFKFIDVDESDWFYDSVMSVYELGLMQGVSENEFKPYTVTLRSMFVTVLYRMAGSPKVSGTSAFTDFEEGQWYSDAILWCEQNNIITGYSDGLFHGEWVLTRENVVTMLYRYDLAVNGERDFEPTDLVFADDTNINDYAKEAVYWAASLGIVNGRGNNLFAPKANILRSEIAKIFAVYVGLK
jgi:hypothetical protein